MCAYRCVICLFYALGSRTLCWDWDEVKNQKGKEENDNSAYK